MALVRVGTEVLIVPEFELAESDLLKKIQDPLFHFYRRFIGKGDRQDSAQGDILGFDLRADQKPKVLLGQGIGLA